MNELWVGGIGAAAAVAGAVVGGWLTRSAGIRQAEAARHAGDRQADALLETMRSTLDEQRRVRAEDRRRQAYVEFLRLTDAVSRAPSDELQAAVDRAWEELVIEGPDEVVRAASHLSSTTRRQTHAEGAPGEVLGEMVAARFTYIRTVRRVLGVAPDPEGPSSS